MRSWRVLIVLVAVLLAPGVFQAVAQNPEREVLLDANGVEVWSDSRASDAPLRGQDVVHRDASDLLVAKEDFERTWIVVVDGERHPSGACGFSLEYSEIATTATPKVFLMTAVDRVTCEVEFTVGIPTDPKVPSAPDLEYDLSDAERIAEGDQGAGGLASGAIGYMSPEAAARLGAEPLYYPLPQIRYTVIAEWMDPPQKIVNRVLSAVKARVANDNKQSHARCKNQRAWLESDQIPSHWQNKSSGRWGEEECNKSNYNTRAVTSARFKNEDFPLCAALNDPAWVYYDGVSARASTTTNRGSFHYNIVSTWQEGCGEILGWAGFRTYPGEYNNINPV
jgi:hypothetical protein